MIEHGSRHRRRRPRRAASVVEFLVAASLVLVIITASSITLRTTQRSVARDRARDTVTVLASNVLEQSALFDCQLSIEPSLSVRRSDEQRGTGPTPCVKLMFDDPTAATNYTVDGDFVYLTQRPGCSTSCDTLVVLASRWLPIGDSAYRCRTTDAPPPALLERRAYISWTPAGGRESLLNEFVSVEAAPRSAGYTDPSRAGLAVPALAGEVVILREKNAAAAAPGALLRVATPCIAADGTATAEAFFPFLTSTQDLEVVLTGSCLPLDASTTPIGCSRPDWRPAALSVLYGANPPTRSMLSIPQNSIETCSGALLRLAGGRAVCEQVAQ